MTKSTSVSFDRKILCFTGLGQELLKTLSQSYPGVDVEKELTKMKAWLMQPRNIKRRGTLQFIHKWLSRATPVNVKDETTHPSLLKKYTNDYLVMLWKGRERLLRFNTM